MASRNDAPFSVHIPRAADDRPAWGKVGAIAILGFAVGIAWPKIAGVRLGPSAPGEATTASATALVDNAKHADTSASAAPAVMASSAPSASVATVAAPVISGPPVISVARGSIMSCKTADGATLKGATACGGLTGFDAIAMPRIRRLGNCAGADGQTGKLSVLMFVDFNANKVGIDIGKSSTLQNLDTLAGCLRSSMQSVSLGAIDHDNARYTVFYGATFTPRDANASSGASSSMPSAVASANAEGPVAQVVWDVAIVRDTPRTGQVIARLQRGTKIHLGGGQEGWYRVKYGADFSSDGWVYRGAIGK
jgi:hypothetical protein